eukprot:NODE_838_length_3589_cov_0.826074.p1 type:complete len:388 gc:universal NODE_838_length_3589_cov_0.826074:2615-1452(-)
MKLDFQISLLITLISLLKPEIHLHKPFRKHFRPSPMQHFNSTTPNQFHKCLPISTRYDLLKNRRVYIALNLHNNEDVIPHLFMNIFQLIYHFGVNSTFLSIYESGSVDKSKRYIRRFSRHLRMMHAKFHIKTGNITLTPQIHRIDYLVRIRNRAMKPFYRQSSHNITYESILFLNDVYSCPNELLELEYQRLLNTADLVGAMDYVLNYMKYPILYDTWVSRDMNGLEMRSITFDHIYKDLKTEKRVSLQLPFQVSCAWNGAVSLSPTPFMNGIHFRRGINTNKTMKMPGECASSECSTLCVDFIKNGFNKMLMVPRSKVTYTWDVFEQIYFSDNRYTMRIPPFLPYQLAESVPIEFEEISKSFKCQPMYDHHRGPRQQNLDYIENYE